MKDELRFDVRLDEHNRRNISELTVMYIQIRPADIPAIYVLVASSGHLGDDNMDYCDQSLQAS
jgi:hypothetical protein